MGIKNLNRYLLDHCSKTSIQKIHLSQLSNKTIVIDTSIYLYKYASENALMEKLYLMISLFRNYNIIPLFIFDGKPPKEKYALLKERKLLKNIAETKYNEIKEKPLQTKEDILLMEKLKKQFVYISENDIKNVKKLFDFYGINYIHAPNEADQLCAYFTKNKNIYACMSDDMDMFVYECPKILRNFNLIGQTVTLYDYNNILKELHISAFDFKTILILSGTDYEWKKRDELSPNIQKLFSYYYTYCEQPTTLSFLEWIYSHKYLLSQNLQELELHINMFEWNNPQFSQYDSIIIHNKDINMNKLIEFLYNYGFIFTKKTT